MVKKVSVSQFKSMVRQQQTKQRRATQKYNQEVRKYNRDTKNAINKHNRDTKSAINKYNREVHTYNRQVKADHAKIKRAVQKLNSHQKSTHYVSLRVSAQTLHTAYEHLDITGRKDSLTPDHIALLDFAEQENANSLDVTNALLGEPAEEQVTEDSLAETTITTELSDISDDLHSRCPVDCNMFCVSINLIHYSWLYTFFF